MGNNWKAKKKNIIKDKLGNSCKQCGSTDNIQIHHIRSVASGGRNLPHNLMLLCGICHDLLHNPNAKKKIEFWNRHGIHKWVI
ncbi:hypothetical protein LCGC14_2603030 [marine sediment metagenome]|uniref:HNH nuclease domain-containing protein n=1 Tax=marine sediment metagenome TaxID=412755 RepID=A0A0F9CJ77_9ZZZZ